MSTDLSALREHIAALQAEHLELSTAGPGREALTPMMEDLVDQLAADGRRRLLASLQSSPMNPFRLAGLGNATDAGPLLVGLLGATSVKKALRGILEDLPAGLPLQQRECRLAELNNALLDLERQEEAMVREMEAQGLPVLRRADARPEVVLA
jgi:hypothetical protein